MSPVMGILLQRHQVCQVCHLRPRLEDRRLCATCTADFAAALAHYRDGAPDRPPAVRWDRDARITGLVKRNTLTLRGREVLRRLLADLDAAAAAEEHRRPTAHSPPCATASSSTPRP